MLKDKFPRLIHCRISGFGADGPLAGAPGYDAVVQAMTGMMSINGMAETGAVQLGAPIVDMVPTWREQHSDGGAGTPSIGWGNISI